MITSKGFSERSVIARMAWRRRKGDFRAITGDELAELVQLEKLGRHVQARQMIEHKHAAIFWRSLKRLTP